MHNSPTLLLVTSLVSIVDVKGKTKRSTYETISYDKLFKNKRCNEIPRDLDNHASKDIIHGNQSLIPFLGFGGDPTSHVMSTKRVPFRVFISTGHHTRGWSDAEPHHQRNAYRGGRPATSPSRAGGGISDNMVDPTQSVW